MSAHHWFLRSLSHTDPVDRLASRTLSATLLVLAIGCGSGSGPSDRSPPRKSGANSDSKKVADQLPRDVRIAAEPQSHFPVPAEPTSVNPLTAAASLVEGSATEGTLELLLAMRIAPGWHIPAMDAVAGPSAPTTIEVELPRGLEQAEPWSVPEPDLDVTGTGPVTRVYTGDIHFRCRLKQTANAFAVRAPIRCRLGYQACNRFSCKPFQTLTLIASSEASGQNEEE